MRGVEAVRELLSRMAPWRRRVRWRRCGERGRPKVRDLSLWPLPAHPGLWTRSHAHTELRYMAGVQDALLEYLRWQAHNGVGIKTSAEPCRRQAKPHASAAEYQRP